MASELIKDYGFAPGNVTVLRNATQKQISDALDDITDPKKGVGEDDRIVIYFAGHGATATSDDGAAMGFLIPSDGQVGDGSVHDLNKSCIPVETVWVKINGSHAKHVVVIVDSCFSGLMVGANRSAYKTKVLSTLLAKRARQAMSAGSSRETSIEMSDVRHGVFTYYFLKELQTRAAAKQVFTVSDVFPEIKRQVANFTDGAQIPVEGSRPGAEGDVIFAPNGCERPQPSKEVRTTDAAYQEGLRANREGRFADAIRLMAPYAAAGDPLALVAEGRTLSNSGHPTEARIPLKKAADKGDPFGEFYWAEELSNMGEASQAVSKAMFEKAVATLQPLAENGDVWAEFLLGRANEYGFAVEKDYVQAMKWYRAAADKGEGVAMLHISDMYRYGRGVEVTPKEVFRWAKTAADQGEDQAMVEVGKCFENGYGVEKNLAQALKYYHDAADAGNSNAFIHLGLIYSEGKGVSQDYVQALHWYEATIPFHQDVDYFEGLTKIYIAAPSARAEVLRSITKWRAKFNTLDIEAQSDVLAKFGRGYDGEKGIDSAFRDIVISMTREYAAKYARVPLAQKKERLTQFSGAIGPLIDYSAANGDYKAVLELYASGYEGLEIEKCTEGEIDNLIRNLEACVIAYLKSGSTAAGKALLKKCLDLYDVAQEERPWDWYGKDAYAHMCFRVAKIFREAGDKEAAKPLIYRGWEVWFKEQGVPNLAGKLHEDSLPLQGEVPSYLSGDDAAFFESFTPGGDPSHKFGIKRFTIPVNFSGVTYPFYIYVPSGPNGYAEVQDQFRWVKEMRGGEVPKEVRDSFKKLAAIAAEHNVSFMDLCVYALGTTSKEEGAGKKPPL